MKKPREAFSTGVDRPSPTDSKGVSNEAIVRALDAAGFDMKNEPFSAEVLAASKAGRNILGIVGHGHVRTGSCLAAVIQVIMTTSPSANTRALVLASTRDMARTLDVALGKAGEIAKLSSTCVYGGVSYRNQQQKLSKGVDVVTATPGRVADHIKQGSFSPDKLEMLVLADAEELLRSGFRHDIDIVFGSSPATRRVVMFAAGYDDAVRKFAAKYLGSYRELHSTTGSNASKSSNPSEIAATTGSSGREKQPNGGIPRSDADSGNPPPAAVRKKRRRRKTKKTSPPSESSSVKTPRPGIDPAFGKSPAASDMNIEEAGGPEIGFDPYETMEDMAVSLRENGELDAGHVSDSPPGGGGHGREKLFDAAENERVPDKGIRGKKSAGLSSKVSGGSRRSGRRYNHSDRSQHRRRQVANLQLYAKRVAPGSDGKLENFGKVFLSVEEAETSAAADEVAGLDWIDWLDEPSGDRKRRRRAAASGGVLRSPSAGTTADASSPADAMEIDEDLEKAVGAILTAVEEIGEPSYVAGEKEIEELAGRNVPTDKQSYVHKRGTKALRGKTAPHPVPVIIEEMDDEEFNEAVSRLIIDAAEEEPEE